MRKALFALCVLLCASVTLAAQPVTFNKAVTTWAINPVWVEYDATQDVFVYHSCYPPVGTRDGLTTRLLLQLQGDIDAKLMGALKPLTPVFEAQARALRLTEAKSLTPLWRGMITSELGLALLRPYAPYILRAVIYAGLDAAPDLVTLGMPTEPAPFPTGDTGSGLCYGVECPAPWRAEQCSCETTEWEDPETRQIPKACKPPRLDCNKYIGDPKLTDGRGPFVLPIFQ